MRPMIEFLGDSTVGVEVGVFEGDNALSILRGMPGLRKLYLIDPYEAYEGYDDPKIHSLKEARKKAVSRLKGFEEKTSWIYSKFEVGLVEEKVDFVYIDGNHDPLAVMYDIEVAETIIKPGGVIGGHDYYESSHFGVKMAVDKYCREGGKKLHQRDTDWWVVSSPRVFYFNLNVGSGIERTGNTVLSMLDDFEVVEYKSQNPPALMFPALLKAQPTVILINEFYPRLGRVTYYYKRAFPDTKVVLLNHCASELAYRSDYLHTDRDASIALRMFWRETVDVVVNLNYIKDIPDYLRGRLVQRYHPIDDKFKMCLPWAARQRDFLYFGSITPHKFSEEFLDKIQATHLKVDVIGPPIRDQAFKKKFDSCKNINYLGFVDEDILPKELNEYRWLIVPNTGREPFNLAIAEATRCGVIPVIAKSGEWNNWLRGAFIECNGVDSVIDFMQNYVTKKEDRNYRELMDRRSYLGSKIITKRTNYDEFKELLRGYLDG